MKKKAVSGGRRAYILTMRILMGAAAIITCLLYTSPSPRDA